MENSHIRIYYRLQRIRKEKKEKDRQQKDMESANRRHLSNMRVVQKNLVYIIGLHPRLATEEVKRLKYLLNTLVLLLIDCEIK